MPKPPLKSCILIPAYREEAHIAPVVREVLDYCSDVIVIDDGSPDETAKMATAAGATVLAHVRNQGKGAALQTGFDHAREQGFDLAITLDADGQHAPSDIPAFFRPGSAPAARSLSATAWAAWTACPGFAAL